MNKKRALVNLYKDIVLVTRVRIFCTALFTNNNIKVVIQIDAFLARRGCKLSAQNFNAGFVQPTLYNIFSYILFNIFD